MPFSLLPNLTRGDATVEEPINQHWNPLYLMRWAAPEITHTFSTNHCPIPQNISGEEKLSRGLYEPSGADATAQSCERDLQLSRAFHNYPTSSQSSVISRQLIWHNRNHRRCRHLLIIHSPSLSCFSPCSLTLSHGISRSNEPHHLTQSCYFWRKSFLFVPLELQQCTSWDLTRK